MLPPLPLLSLVVENCHYLLVSGPFLAHKFSRLRFSQLERDTAKCFLFLAVLPCSFRQCGQPVPPVLCATEVCHSCLFLHNHHTFLPFLAVILSGVRFPFLEGCHSFATFGNLVRRLFSLVSFLPEQ